MHRCSRRNIRTSPDTYVRHVTHTYVTWHIRTSRDTYVRHLTHTYSTWNWIMKRTNIYFNRTFVKSIVKYTRLDEEHIETTPVCRTVDLMTIFSSALQSYWEFNSIQYCAAMSEFISLFLILFARKCPTVVLLLEAHFPFQRNPISMSRWSLRMCHITALVPDPWWVSYLTE